jgi:hypothetical protein
VAISSEVFGRKQQHRKAATALTLVPEVSFYFMKDSIPR